MYVCILIVDNLVGVSQRLLCTPLQVACFFPPCCTARVESFVGTPCLGLQKQFFVVLEELLQLGRGMENTNYVGTRSQQEQAAAAISADVNNEGEYLVILVLGKRPKLSSSLLCLGR
jgi:hypothetical protein